MPQMFEGNRINPTEFFINPPCRHRTPTIDFLVAPPPAPAPTKLSTFVGRVEKPAVRSRLVRRRDMKSRSSP